MQDRARIQVTAGAGGDGCLSFRREAHVPKGGPNGGDGGRGGDVVLVCDDSMRDLETFRRKAHFKARRAGNGEGALRHGKDGETLEIRVPPGTEAIIEADGSVHDLVRPGQRAVVARGGPGGRGNKRFAGPTHQTPRFAEKGLPGGETWITLQLKLLADVGLVGYPNVGKSTLISRISAARPKIADYPFTTLEPNLGVVSVGDPPHEDSFVVADIPGLIEGAHLGAGLGMQFLRHIERTRVLVHLVDVSDASGRPDPVEDFRVIMDELKSFGHGLDEKPMLVVASKADVANPEKLKKLRAMAKRRKLPFFAISAVSGAGIAELKYALGERVRASREAEIAPVAAPTILAEY
jgi:GTP-binding protein